MAGVSVVVVWDTNDVVFSPPCPYFGEAELCQPSAIFTCVMAACVFKLQL